MNSFSNMQMAVEAEVKRQVQLYEENPNTPHEEIITQATYRWDPDLKETVLMRRKEYADDCRYFPEPDLPPIVLKDAYIEEIRSRLPELPLQRERRYVADLNLTPHNAFFLASDKPLADYFEQVLLEYNHPRQVCNWMIIEFAGRFKDSGTNLVESGITPHHLAKLLCMVEDGTINGRIAKDVADDMVREPGKDPTDIVAANPDYQPLNDQGEIEQFVVKVLSENEQSIVDYKAGKEKAFAFLVGQVMKLSRGKASPQIVNSLLKEKIQSL